MIFGSGVFLRILSIIALLDGVHCLFKSHYSYVVMVVVVESVSVFLFKRQTQSCDKSCITLIRRNQVCIWMNVIRKLVLNVVWDFPSMGRVDGCILERNPTAA